jgi:hypothetical protein
MRMTTAVALGLELGGGSAFVVGAGELADAKVPRTVVARLLQAGTWMLLWRGMYVCMPGPVTAKVLAHGAIKHARQRNGGAREQPRPVVSGLIGCAARGLRWVPEREHCGSWWGPTCGDRHTTA